MLITSHIAVTEILCRILKLSGSDYLLAHLFGWGIDIDHIVTQLKYFIEDIKLSYHHWKKRHWLEKFLPHRLVIFLDKFNKKRSAISEPRSWIQEPTGILLILGLSLIINNYIPVLFLFIHFLMDAVMRFNKYPLAPFTKKLKFKGWLPNTSYTEYMISSLILAFLIIWRLIG
ncbi:MAG: hypothetical protein U5L76_02815 [Patescibacteria group bacterium]|nr:hypothetical protein [Patescibacteria group bacterium]